MKGEQKMIYLDAESLERLDEMKKSGVNLSKFCQDAMKSWLGKSNDYDSLREKLKLLKQEHEENLLVLNNQKLKAGKKIKKATDDFYSIKNKTLEMLGENSRERVIKNIKDKYTLKEEAEKLIKEFIKETFRSYINYLFYYKLPEDPEDDVLYSKYASEFWDKVEPLFEKFMKNYKGTFNKDYFEVKDAYSPIKRFVSENSKSFIPKIFLENKDPDRYETSEVYLYMPLKEVENT